MRIAQLSDPHVRPRGVLYQGVIDSNQRLADAVAQLLAPTLRPDLVLISGDLTDEGAPEAYAMLAELLAPLTMPVRLMPGNHDRRAALRAAFPAHTYLRDSGPLHHVLEDAPLRVVALDSTAPGQHHGALGEAGLRWLRQTLAARPQQPTLVLLHHPPVATGIPYMDAYGLQDGQALAALIRGFTQVEAVLCGHVHRGFFRRWAGTVLAGCPSTASQIALRLAPDAQPASYAGPSAGLLHHWEATRGLLSHLLPFDAQAGPYPFY